MTSRSMRSSERGRADERDLSAQPVEPRSPIVIVLVADGSLILGGEPITLANLVGAVETRVGDDRTRAIHLRDDRTVDDRVVVGVIDRSVTKGLAGIVFLTDPRSLSGEPSIHSPARGVGSPP
jgi:biopolymer transport protein ExbD